MSEGGREGNHIKEHVVSEGGRVQGMLYVLNLLYFEGYVTMVHDLPDGVREGV